MRRIKPILALALALALTLTACGSAGTASSAAVSASSAKSNTLVYGSNDYTRINPALDEHGEINALLFDGLTGHDKSQDRGKIPHRAADQSRCRGRKVHHRGHPGPEKRVRKRFQL